MLRPVFCHPMSPCPKQNKRAWGNARIGVLRRNEAARSDARKRTKVTSVTMNANVTAQRKRTDARRNVKRASRGVNSGFRFSERFKSVGTSYGSKRVQNGDRAMWSNCLSSSTTVDDGLLIACEAHVGRHTG